MNDSLKRREFFAVGAGLPGGLWGGLVEAGMAEDRKPVVKAFRPEDIGDFERQSEGIQRLIRIASALTHQELGYTYGSNDPGKGGMDCSGTVHRALTEWGIDAPRSSHAQYLWAKEAGALREIEGRVASVADPALRELRPGHLVFWEGTYETGQRQPPISHVMIYLGILKADGKPVLFGASSGRSFRGTRIHGVSAFDFHFPTEGEASRIVGFGPVPGLR